MTEHTIERLSEYIDGELTPREREEIEDHLAGCGECSAVLEDLREVVSVAARAANPTPSEDLWPGIEARIASLRSTPRVVPIETRRGPTRRRFSFSIPQLAAASVALVLLSGASVWLAVRGGETRTSPVPTVASRPAGTSATGTLVSDVSSLGPEYAGYEAAMVELQRLFDSTRDQIEPATREAIEENLAIIDAAIRQTLQALESDPNSLYLNAHLAKTMRRRLDVLRDATMMPRTAI